MSTPDKTEFESAYALGMAAVLDTVDVGGVEHALIPEGAKVQSFERLMPAPIRIRASHQFHDISSFARYFKEFAEEGTRIFVDEAKAEFVAVFDCDHKGKPAWGEHRISLKLDVASEWRKFVSFNNKKLEQREFAEFLEDSVDYIVGPEEYTGARLLEMASNISIDIKGQFSCQDTMAEGLKQLVIKDESTATANVNGKVLKFPPQMQLALRVFRGSKTYNFPVHLRHRVRKEGLLFWITIPDVERVVEQAFDAVITELKDACEREVFRGSYGSRNSNN